MHTIKLLVFSLSFFAATTLCCGLVLSQLSIYPKYQHLLVNLLNIQSASMPLDVMYKLLCNPLFALGTALIAGIMTRLIETEE
ncbi:TPA: hypothetical protein ACWWDF_002417 [Enterococcus faecium]